MYAVLAMSYNLVLGNLGLFSLAQSAFFGIGAYVSALLSLHAGLSFLPAFLVSGIVASVFAYAIGWVALRTSYHAFAIITLAFALVMQYVVKNWVTVTGGPMGIPGIPSPVLLLPGLFTMTISSMQAYYYLILVLTVASFVFFYRLVNSRIGRAFLSVRENALLAGSFGINVAKYKLMAFMISAFFTGLVGSFYAYYISFISPEVFDFSITVTLLVMVVVGGRGNLEGVFVTSYALFIIPELLRITPAWREIIYGIVMFCFVLFMPEGLAKLKRKPGMV